MRAKSNSLLRSVLHLPVNHVAVPPVCGRHAGVPRHCGVGLQFGAAHRLSLLGLLVECRLFSRLYTNCSVSASQDSNSSLQFLFYLTSCIKMTGNIMYIFAGSVPGRRVCDSQIHSKVIQRLAQDFFMAEGRLLVGLGAGNMALCNAYVTQATTLKERTAAVANLAATGVCSRIFPRNQTITFVSCNDVAIIVGFTLNLHVGSWDHLWTSARNCLWWRQARILIVCSTNASCSAPIDHFLGS